jgi:hypothetical protein
MEEVTKKHRKNLRGWLAWISIGEWRASSMYRLKGRKTSDMQLSMCQRRTYRIRSKTWTEKKKREWRERERKILHTGLKYTRLDVFAACPSPVIPCWLLERQQQPQKGEDENTQAKI